MGIEIVLNRAAWGFLLLVGFSQADEGRRYWSSPTLSPYRIAMEFNAIASTSSSSVDRIVRAVKLSDSMYQAKLTPSLAQLKGLLESDVSDIRVFACDWFMLSPPKAIDEKAEFLIAALKTKPLQVRERAYDAVLKFTPEDIRYFDKKGVFSFDSCTVEQHLLSKELCKSIEINALMVRRIARDLPPPSRTNLK